MPDNVSKPLRIVWGADAIGEIINRSSRQTFHLLENGHIAGAFKAGRRHGLNVDVFEESTRSAKQTEACD